MSCPVRQRKNPFLKTYHSSSFPVNPISLRNDSCISLARTSLFQEFPHFFIYNLWNSLKDNEMQ